MKYFAIEEISVQCSVEPCVALVTCVYQFEGDEPKEYRRISFMEDGTITNANGPACNDFPLEDLNPDDLKTLAYAIEKTLACLTPFYQAVAKINAVVANKSDSLPNPESSVKV